MEPGYWVAPKLWPNRTVFVLGGGTSLASLDLTLIHDQRVIGVNDAYLLGDFVDTMIFSDSKWYFSQHQKPLRKFAGLKVSTNKLTLSEPGIRTLQRMSSPICTMPGCIGWARNTGLAAVNLALIFGASTIVLLGFDMYKAPCKINGRGFNADQVHSVEHEYTNWHKNINPADQSDQFPIFIDGFKSAAHAINLLDVRVVNANPKSKIDCFEKMPYEEAVCLR